MIPASWGPAVRHLVDAGLLDGDAVVSGRLLLRTASRSNHVALLRVDGAPLAVLKRHEDSADDVDPFQAEVAAYRWLAANSNAALAPRLITVEDRTIVLEDLSGARPFHEVLAGSGQILVEGAGEALLAGLGRQLAALHSASAGDPALPPRRPWVLAVAGGETPEALVPDPEVGPLVAEISADAPLRAVLEEFSRAWRAATPIHGDVKFDNILVSFDAAADEARLTLLDWELAGLGVPAWDLAGGIEGLMVPALRCGETGDTGAALEEARAARAMIAGYREGVGAALIPDNRALAVATVARLVQSTIQLQAMRHLDPVCAEGARKVLCGARALAAQLHDGAPGPQWIH